MSGRRTQKCSSSPPTNGFSSTPLKSFPGKDVLTPGNLDNGVLSSDEDTFSLLSPIYHDSFESDDEDDDVELSPNVHTGRRYGRGVSLDSNSSELPTAPAEKVPGAAVRSTASQSLSAWEQWLVNKAKEDRLKQEKSAEEEEFHKLRLQEEEEERKQKKIVMEEKIQEWLKMKREKEKNEQLLKQCKEVEETQRLLEKRQEVELRARQKYKDWLQKKNKAKIEKQQKEKEEAVLKEEQEKERRKRAEEKFKEWVAKTNERSNTTTKSPCSPRSPYETSCPSPSFYNPIPWKPIPIPPLEPAGKKPSNRRKGQHNSRINCRLRNTASADHMLKRR